MPILSIIIPFGLSKERMYIEKRIIKKAENSAKFLDIEYIFVEGYSSYSNEKLEKIIKDNGHIYIKDFSQKDFFSQGCCRNLGASYANSKVLMFLDIDCYISNNSLEKIINLIKIKDIENNLNSILVLPVIYLLKDSYDKLKHYSEELWDSVLQNDLLSAKNEFIKFFAPSSTSSIIINKHKFLELGGNDNNFKGHGYEDFDLFARVLQNCINFEKKAKNILYDSRNWQFKSFSGFRAWFSLLGYEACFYGIYMYHFWHIEPNQNSYMSNKDNNHKLFYKHLKNIKNHKIRVLQDKNALGKSALLLSNNLKIFDKTRALSVYFGEIFINQEEKINEVDVIFLDSDYKLKNNLNLNIIYFKEGILNNSYYFYKNKEYDFSNIDFNKIILKENSLNELSTDEKNKLKKILKEYNISLKAEEFLYLLKNYFYSFYNENSFYKIRINNEEILNAKSNDKIFYPLKSLIYKAYFYELGTLSFFSFFSKIFAFDFILAKISQSKFYRLLRKLLFNPKDFIIDAKEKRKK